MGGDLFSRQLCGDDQVPAAATTGQLQEVVPYSSVELIAGRLHTVPVVHTFGCGDRIDVEQHCEIGDQTIGRPSSQPRHLVDAQGTTRSLVGNGGIDISITDDDPALFEGRSNHLGKMLCLVSVVEQGLCLGARPAPW